jgi:chromate transporter
MTNNPKPALWDLFTTWFIIGIQSFGGGSSTLLLIHQACIKRGWIDEDEFVRTWALVQIAPGINLVKLTSLVGYKLRGWPGLLSANAGLLLTSALVTVLMTAGFAVIQSQPVVKAIMRGVLPATIGLTLTMGAQMAIPLLSKAYQQGKARLGANLAILTCAALLMAVNGISPVVVLLVGGVAGILLLAVTPIRPAAAAREDAA